MTVTAPGGFVAAGAHCGIKVGGVPDLALVATDDGKAVPAAAVFTSNLATAAPVQVSRRHLEASGGQAVAVVLHSGNANPPTRAAGRDHPPRQGGPGAPHLGRPPQHVLACPTGPLRN